MDKYESYIGKVLDGRYKILELVGVGGMAFVLKAEDLVMNRIVAIKILNDQYNGDEQAEKRFINESKAVAMLSNKSIVCVYDVAIFPDIKYIVMEYLDGITLKEYMDNKGKLPWKEACVYIVQILRALEHAHSKDVIHRDIKPQNIILLKNGEIKVTDFGIAKTPDTETITVTDKAIGTVYYISPEQASGRETTYASDIYSVGVMLYESVTGQLPFVADTPVAIAMMQINDEPKPPIEIDPELPVGLSQIILKAMEKNVEDRFSDAHSMLKAVNYIIKYPDVVFNNEDIGENEEQAEYVDINMINTGEIEDYIIAEAVKPSEEAVTDQEEDEKALKKKKRKQKREERRSHSLFPVISGVFIAFMIVALAVGVYMFVKWVPNLFGGNSTEDFIVNKFIGQTYSETMVAEMEKNKYKVNIEYKNNEHYAYNEIIDQDPTPGPRKEPSGYCRITLTVNSYLGEIEIPDLKYKNGKDAKELLESLGFVNVEIHQENDLYIEENQVIRTDPVMGTIAKSDDIIKIYVSRGMDNIDIALPVPNVVGLNEEDAKKALQNHYLGCEVKYVDSQEAQGTVIEQSEKEGVKNLSPNYVITITVSNGSQTFEMPNLMGETYTKVQEILTEYGLLLGTVEYNTNSGYNQNDIVCYQSITAGTSVNKGDTIDIELSKIETAEKGSPFPRVVGLTEANAKTRIINAGYTVEVQYEESTNTAKGNVIRTDKTVDAVYDKGTLVTIYVSLGDNKTTVPDLLGKTSQEAEQALREAGLDLGTIEYDNDPDSENEGKVVDQNHEAGSTVEGGTQVNIVLGGIQP